MVTNSIRDAFALEETEFVIQKLEGYHGNQIISVNAHLIGKRADAVASRLMSNLDRRSKNELLAELDSRIDEHGSLYIRVDKEALVIDGQSRLLVLGQDESVRIKLKPKHRPASREETLEKYRSLFD